MRQMKLIGFLQAQNCSNYPASWRHPLAQANWASREYYEHIGRTLEAGKFHLAFFDDRLAIPDRFGDDFSETVRYGIRAAKLDPVAVALTMGLATEKLGIGVTYSTTYYEPFHVARVFATVDLLLKGRAAWNVVTSLNDSEAANFGLAKHLEHDLRYDRADEFMEVVLGHWDTWEDDAIALDRESGAFADPEKVHRLDHKGKFFSSRGPFTVPRSPQGHPVIIQAGQSGRGKEFAARWGELLFVIHPHLATAQKHYREMKEAPARRGREITIAAAFYPVVAETQTEAEDRFALVDGLAKPIDSLVLLSEVLNFDFAAKAPDEPLSDDDLRSMTGIQAVRDRVVQLSGKPNPTVKDFSRLQWPRHAARTADLRRHCGQGRRSDGGMVCRRRLRRICHCRDPCAGHLRGLRAARRPRAAAARPVPARLPGRYAARQSGPAAAAARLSAPA